MAGNETLTGIAGIEVGHYTDAVAQTGCTVIVLPEPSVLAAEVRGAAPATREYALLAAGMTVEQAHAVVLSGGSAYGLATADGVMAELEAQGRGYVTNAAVIPIVPTACLYDLAVGDANVRPGAVQGAAAFQAASSDPVPQGLVGAGTGSTCAKWRAESLPGGLGSSLVTVGEAKVAALVAVNALGDAFTLEGEPLTGGPAVAGPRASAPEQQNTTLAVVATDAALTRSQLSRLLVRAHDAFAVCLRPAHTAADGDICFAISTGTAQAESHNLAEGAFEAVGRAIENAIRCSA